MEEKAPQPRGGCQQSRLEGHSYSVGDIVSQKMGEVAGPGIGQGCRESEKLSMPNSSP